MKIHVWVPDYTSAIGGIQTFSRFLVRGLRDVFPTAQILVFSKNDTSFPDPGSDPSDKFTPFGWWHPKLRTLAFVDEIFRAAIRDRPDFIFAGHANFAPVAYLIRKIFGTRFAAVGYGVEVWNIPKWSIRVALRAANPLLAISEFTRQRMAAALQMAPTRIEILPCMFDSEEFYPGRKPHFLLKRYGLAPSQPVILTITRLAGAERYKGYDQIFRALPAIRSRYPNVRYLLGGRGRDRQRIEKLIKQLGIEDNVTLAGYVPDYELRSHYNLCDVFAMPSKGEGFGIVFLEALACGKPVLAGNKDGSVDAVLNGELGALVDPDNVDEIASSLRNILDRAHSNRIDEANGQLRTRVIQAYGYDRFRDTLATVLQPLVRSTKRCAE